MKHLKMSMYLLLTAAIFTSCEKDIIELSQSAETIQKTGGKESLGAMEAAQIPLGLYALYPWGNNYDNEVALYDYDATTDNLSFSQFLPGTTGYSNNFGFDFNNENGQVYLLAGERTMRNLYTYDIQNNSSQFIAQITSVEGNNQPSDLTFGKNGILYFVFQSGEINAYNVATQTMSEFANVPQEGATGLTYDFDNNRLIYVTGDEPINLWVIDLDTGNANQLFSFNVPDDNGYPAQAIEYVGNNKCIASGTYSLDMIYTIDLLTESVELLAEPTGSWRDIKDFMYIANIDTDADDDGVLDEDDAHPNSDMREYLNIAGNSTTIKNKMVKNGSTMMDQLNDLIAQTNAQYNGENYAYHHKRFMTELSQLTYKWRMAKLITATQRSQISSIAWGATIPYYNEF